LQHAATHAGCSLCEGLEEKLRAVLAAASYKADGQLRRAALSLRTVSEADEPALAMEVPLLRHRGRGGAAGGAAVETPLARPAPRVSAAKLAQALEAALSALSGDA
jgi:hypothetical protein